MATTIHLGLSVDVVETWPHRSLKGLLRDKETRRQLSADEVRAHLLEARARGIKVIPMDCPSPLPDGSCPGHESVKS